MTIRWGFVGAGWIATRALAPAVHAATGARLQAVASRDADRSAALEPERVHGSYDALLDDDTVDAVYVCLANDQHEEWTVRALRAGKHVLCEKPLALDAASAGRMAAAARDVDRLLVEAVWCRWHPRFRRLVALCRSGAVGRLEAVDTAFTFPGDIDGNYRADPARGGGALLDVGGYQVSAWLAVTGAGRVQVDAVERELSSSGVDLTTAVSASVPGGVRLTGVASFARPEEQRLVVTGSDAVVRTGAGAAFTTWREPCTLVVGDRTEEFPAVDAYRLMVEAVSERIAGGDAWVLPMADTLDVAAAVDAIAAHP